MKTPIAVEVKSRPALEGKDIRHHLRRLQLLSEYRRALGEEPKRVLGAIAWAIAYPESRREALAAGLFVVEQSGDTMRIKVPKNFVPREW